MKKIRFVLTIIFVLYLSVSAYGKELSVYAQGAVLMEYETGRVLWQKNMKQELPMASTTKIMTAIIAIESGKAEEIVEVSQKAASAPKVKMGLIKGEKYRLIDLLYPLMLVSANDAAVAIAEHTGKSVEGFADLMNKKAKDIGAYNTEFVTPNGLDKDNHHSTAYDMALITRYAIKNKKFVDIINTQSKEISSLEGRRFEFYNKNRLLREYKGALGVKTGFTGKAGNCFVGAAKRNGMTLISVVLASGWGSLGKERKWSDTKALLDYGFDNFKTERVIEKGTKTGKVEVLHSKEGYVNTETLSDGYACVSKEEKENLKTVFNTYKTVEAPVKKGDVLGMAEVFTSDGEKLCETEIISCRNIERHDFYESIKKVLKKW